MITAALQAIRLAPSHPPSMAPVGLAITDLPPSLEPSQLRAVHAGIVALAAACRTLGATAGEHGTEPGDRSACDRIVAAGAQVLTIYRGRPSAVRG